MTRNMSVWDLENTVAGSWPLKDIFIRKMFVKKNLSPQLQISGQTDRDFNERGQFQTSFQNAEALQVIGIISSSDMQIKFKLKMTVVERKKRRRKGSRKNQPRPFWMTGVSASVADHCREIDGDTADHSAASTLRARGKKPEAAQPRSTQTKRTWRLTSIRQIWNCCPNLELLFACSLDLRCLLFF